ncbi:MAG: glutaredoxin 3 [Alphaproteobacteria bacterium]|nr:glutaredoxin 3 [Alphaproteobacteria bacterium]
MANVTIYTRKFCGFCTAAKHLLDSKNVRYEEQDATFSKDLRQEMIQRAGGRSTFPQIFVGKTHIGGCDELHALDRNGKLDDLLRAAA